MVPAIVRCNAPEMTALKHLQLYSDAMSTADLDLICACTAVFAHNLSALDFDRLLQYGGGKSSSDPGSGPEDGSPPP